MLSSKVAIVTNSAGGEETVGLIRKAGGTATFIAADVSRAQDCESLVDGGFLAH